MLAGGRADFTACFLWQLKKRTKTFGSKAITLDIDTERNLFFFLERSSCVVSSNSTHNFYGHLNASN